jgi:hypothetical protein
MVRVAGAQGTGRRYPITIWQAATGPTSCGGAQMRKLVQAGPSPPSAASESMAITVPAHARPTRAAIRTQVTVRNSAT